MRKAKISVFIALFVVGLMFTAIPVVASPANSSNSIFTTVMGYMTANSANDATDISSECILPPGEWTFVNCQGVKAYPDLREYIWQTDRPPYGPFDKIALHRLVKSGIEPRGVVFILPGTWSSGEQLVSNPPEDTWTMYENYSISHYLANRGFDVYVIDYRTHFVPIILNSSQLGFMVDWGWDVWISDIKEAVNLAKILSGAERIYMAGESFGGSAAMNYASLYWQEDLKGLILLDGGSGAKYPELVTNSFDLPAAINLMIATGNWSREVGTPGSIFIMKFADQYPNYPAVNPATGLPLEPVLNPFTGQPWANITEWAAFAIYMAWGPGRVSNIYGGYGNPRVMIHINAEFDRYWPATLTLESSAIRDWDNCPYVTHDFDDLYSEVDVPLIAFASGLFGAALGPLRHGIANPDFIGIILPEYGHLDVYSGEYSEADVKVPTYEWMISHKMLVGYGRVRIDRHWTCGEITMYINGTVIDLKIDDTRVAWDISGHKSLRNLEIYSGNGDLGRIQILITHRGPAVAAGPKVHFLGLLV